MLFMYILAAAMASVTLAVPYYEPPSLTIRQACAGMNLNCTCACTCGEGAPLSQQDILGHQSRMSRFLKGCGFEMPELMGKISSHVHDEICLGMVRQSPVWLHISASSGLARGTLTALRRLSAYAALGTYLKFCMVFNPNIPVSDRPERLEGAECAWDFNTAALKTLVRHSTSHNAQLQVVKGLAVDSSGQASVQEARRFTKLSGNLVVEADTMRVLATTYSTAIIDLEVHYCMVSKTSYSFEGWREEAWTAVSWILWHRSIYSNPSMRRHEGFILNSYQIFYPSKSPISMPFSFSISQRSTSKPEQLQRKCTNH
ncbi:hypothetical protein B0H19DRAFT_1072189 [Mycena capillaripes]|nr:hypothetical protein B0H19DRAFT_1072189 [Mycena capillaripes]